MKINLYVSILLAMTVHLALASDVTNEWGAIAYNAQMSIQLEDTTKEIKTNQPVNLIIQIKAISTNEMCYFVICSRPTDFSWIITSPSGKNFSFKESQPMTTFATMMVRLDQIPDWKEEFNLGSIYSFNEIGTYKVTAKKVIITPSGRLKYGEITSNTLNVVISK